MVGRAVLNSTLFQIDEIKDKQARRNLKTYLVCFTSAPQSIQALIMSFTNSYTPAKKLTLLQTFHKLECHCRH